MPPKSTRANDRDILASLNELKEEGFPIRVSAAFQRAADELNCVIWSRVPGTATTTLINEEYNLKPFTIKGKSCNWGPMAGFVCQLPAFNKAGTGKMDGNLKAHQKSLKDLVKKQKEAIATFDAKNSGKKALEPAKKYEAIGIASSLFLPITISETRKSELLKDYLSTDGNTVHTIDANNIVGIAQDKGKTVVVEYLMKRRDAKPLWDIYHRNILVKKADDTYVSYLESQPNGFFIKHQPGVGVQPLADFNQVLAAYNPTVLDKRENSTPAIDAKLRELSGGSDFSGALTAANMTQFYPISALQSPFLVYKDPSKAYKNAVSGDYDLFAVWPLAPESDFAIARRISEGRSPAPLSKTNQNLFIPSEVKDHSLELAKSRNVFIEFIGTFSELDGVEDPEVGNINELVELAGQTINSLVITAYQGNHNPFPNRVFHSDEGGRPQVDELEYPIAFFMPLSYWSKVQPVRGKQESKAAFTARQAEFRKQVPSLKSTAGLANSHTEFVSLVLALKAYFYIFIHDGWMMHLMCLAAGKQNLQGTIAALPATSTVGKQRIGYLKDRIKEIVALGKENSIPGLVPLLTQLLTPLTPAQQTDNKTVAAYKQAFELVMISFVEIASVDNLPSTPDRMVAILKNQIKLSG